MQNKVLLPGNTVIRIWKLLKNNNMNNYLLIGLGLGSVAMTGHANTKETEKSQKPNVIFIVADDVGYGDLSCYGEKTIHTPNVERLANSGIRFTDAHSVAATSTPSRYSLFTGCYSWRRDDTGIAPGNAGMIIRPEQETVADVFKAAGYTTGAIGKWHLGLGDKTGTQDWNGLITPGPRDLGFDYSYLMAATGDRVPCVWIEDQKVANYDPTAPIYVSYKTPFPGEPLGKTHPELLTKLHPSHRHDMAIVNGISRIGYMKGGGKALWKDEDIADTITAKAVQFIEQQAGNPFFLYVGTNDIHVPRYPHARFRGKSGMGYRGDAILQFDWTVGEIMKALEEQGIADNTIIILTSDNGPVIDDGYKDQAKELLGEHRPWGDYRGTKYSIYEAGTRVPFIVSWPGKVKPAVSAALVSQVDLFASMAALVGEDIPQGAAGDSQNQLPALLDKDKKGREYIIESAGNLAISTGEWKYISPRKKAANKNAKGQLYQLREDIGEKKNVIDQYPEKAESLKQLLEMEVNKK